MLSKGVALPFRTTSRRLEQAKKRGVASAFPFSAAAERYNPGKATPDELRSLARGRSGSNSGAVTSMLSLEAGLFLKGTTPEQAIQINEEVVQSPLAVLECFRRVQAQFLASAGASDDTMGVWYAGRADDRFAGGMSEALSVFSRGLRGYSRGTTPNMLVMVEHLIKAVEENWSVADRRVDIIGCYVTGQGTNEVRPFFFGPLRRLVLG